MCSEAGAAQPLRELARARVHHEGRHDLRVANAELQGAEREGCDAVAVAAAVVDEDVDFCIV